MFIEIYGTQQRENCWITKEILLTEDSCLCTGVKKIASIPDIYQGKCPSCVHFSELRRDIFPGLLKLALFSAPSGMCT